MPRYDVEIHHNNTYSLAGVRSPALREGIARALPTDYFEYLCTLRLTAGTPEIAFQMAFRAGTAREFDLPGSREYDRYAERSIAVGDVAIVHTPDGVRIAYIGPNAEWIDITGRNDFTSITPGEPSRSCT